MKGKSICVGEAEIPAPKTHIMPRTAAKVLGVTS